MLRQGQKSSQLKGLSDEHLVDHKSFQKFHFSLKLFASQTSRLYFLLNFIPPGSALETTNNHSRVRSGAYLFESEVETTF